MAIVDGSDHFYVYICDRCRKILYEGHGKIVKNFITEIGKKDKNYTIVRRNVTRPIEALKQEVGVGEC